MVKGGWWWAGDNQCGEGAGFCSQQQLSPGACMVRAGYDGHCPPGGALRPRSPGAACPGPVAGGEEPVRVRSPAMDTRPVLGWGRDG